MEGRSMLVLVLILTSSSVESLTPEIVNLVTPVKAYGEACGYEGCPVPRHGFLNVHVVPHTHYEMGGMRTFAEHYTGYEQIYDRSPINMKRTLDYVVNQLWKNQERTFTLSDFPYFFHWWSQRDSTIRRIVYQLVRQGRLHFVGGGWSMTDEATTSYHAIIESYTYSLRKINNTFLSCARPLVAWQSDVMGHSREFASLAAMMGFDALFLNPMSFDDELARMRRWALEFMWRGSDDLGMQSDIFVHKLFDGFWAPPGFCFSTKCKDPYIVHSDTVMANADKRATEFINSMWYRQSSNYNTNHVMVIMGEILGYFDAELWYGNIDSLIEAVNTKAYESPKKMHLMYSTPACYLKSVMEANPALETKQDDFFPYAYDKVTYLTGFYTTSPSIKLMIKEALVYLQMAKQMQVLVKITGKEKMLDDFMWILGVFQDHTIITGGSRYYVKDYYNLKMYVAMQKITLLLKEAWNKLRNSPKETLYYRCSFNISSCHNAFARHAFFVMIYNPLGWPTSIPVRLPIRLPGDFKVYAPNGAEVPHVVMKIPEAILSIKYRMTSADHELVFFADNIPAIGYKSYLITKNLRRKKRTLIKNLKLKKNKKFLSGQKSVLGDEVSDSKTTPKMGGFANFEFVTSGPNDTDDTEEDGVRLKKQSEDDEPTPEDPTPEDRSPSTPGSNPTEAHHQVPRAEQRSPEEPGASTDRYVEWEADDNYKGIATTDLSFKEIVGLNSDTALEPSNEKTSTTDVKQKTEVEFTSSTAVPENKRTKKPSTPKTTHTQRQSTKRTTETTPTTEAADTSTKRTTTTTTEEPAPETTVQEEDMMMMSTTEMPPEETTTESDDGKKKAQETFGESSDLFIENKYIRINLEPTSRKLTDVTLSNGVHVKLDLQFYYYVSDDPARLNRTHLGYLPPGPYVFRALDNTPIPVLDYLDAKVYKNSLVEEVHYAYSHWAALVVRLYIESPVVEVDWLVGPVPVDDTLGKEVFLRYMTDLVNEGTFFTDSNGRQTIKRIRNMRPMFDSLNTDPVAGNYYPVTSKIYLEDKKKNIRMAILNDRCQGGASLYDGEIDLMLTRRIITDDTPLNTLVNDTEYGAGVVTRGRHYLYLSKADFYPNRIFEKKLAKEIELGPQLLVSAPDPYGHKTKEMWFKEDNEYGFLMNKLPVGIHLLTLEQWNEGTILLRLENYLEKSDMKKAGRKTVQIKNLFKNIAITKIKETMLAANIWAKDWRPYNWTKKEKFVKNFNDFYGTGRKVEFLKEETFKGKEEPDLERGITLIPQQIRTFVCWFDYV